MLPFRRVVRAVLAFGLCMPIAASACATSEDADNIEFNGPDASADAFGGGTAGTGGSGTGSCSVTFCPSGGSGTPCCISPNGPCGVNLGSGCTLPPSADF